MRRRRIDDLIAFAGPETIRSMCLLWFLSLGFLFLELTFAFLLQRFLVVLGLIGIPNAIFGTLDLTLTQVVVLILVVTIARMGFGFALTLLQFTTVERFSHRMRTALIERSLHASSVNGPQTLTFFSQRISTASMVIHSVQTLAWQGTHAAGLLIALTFMSPILTGLMALLVAAIALLPIRTLNQRLKRSSMLQSGAFSAIMLHLGNVLRNFLLIRLYNLQGKEQARIDTHLQRYSDLIHQYHRFEALSGTVGPFLIALSILCIAIGQHTTAALDPRLAVPYLYLFFRLAQSLVPIVANASRLAFASTEFRSIRDWWLARPVRSVPEAGHERIEAVRSPIGWRLEDVTFGFSDQRPLFQRLTLSVVPGSLFRIRGESGAGKSSLLALLIGEAAPESGSVLVQLNGEWVGVAEGAARLRNHIGYSGPEPFLFEGTILENVTYGLGEPPAGDLLQDCAAVAECSFILELPGGFEHRIDELGRGLSTGQKQRLSLLRALLRKPRALILDEALSNVDVPTENRILTHLMARKQECTIVYVSHREHPGLAEDQLLDLG